MWESPESDLELAQSAKEAPSHLGPTEDGFGWEMANQTQENKVRQNSSPSGAQIGEARTRS